METQKNCRVNKENWFQAENKIHQVLDGKKFHGENRPKVDGRPAGSRVVFKKGKYIIIDKNGKQIN